MKKFLVPFVALLSAAIVGGVAAVGVWEVAGEDAAPAAAPVTTTTTVNRPVSSSGSSIAQIYKDTITGVVTITAQTGEGAATGSGWVLDADGHVVTNQHVVSDASEVTVTFHDGSDIQARVVGTDASTDVALLELSRVPKDLQPLQLGSADALEIGDPVIAIGSPFGLEGTVTSGIVSAKNRQLQAPNNYTIDGAIQTDAALNKGNSGGPLLDAQGRLVGMNSQIASESGGNDGVGYAIPIETIRNVVQQLENGGTVKYAYLGVQLGDAQDGGAQIGSVRAGSPADDAGLQAGDVVTAAGGTEVADGDALRNAVADRQPGDELELTVKRNGDARTVTVTLGTRPSS